MRYNYLHAGEKLEKAGIEISRLYNKKRSVKKFFIFIFIEIHETALDLFFKC